MLHTKYVNITMNDLVCPFFYFTFSAFVCALRAFTYHWHYYYNKTFLSYEKKFGTSLSLQHFCGFLACLWGFVGHTLTPMFVNMMQEDVVMVMHKRLSIWLDFLNWKNRLFCFIMTMWEVWNGATLERFILVWENHF